MLLNDSRLVVRAFSPDNDRQVHAIVDLFRRTYGADYPFQNVYRPQFWKAHIAHRFSSLVAILDGTVVAHLAIQPNAHDTKTVQLAYPAIDPSFVELEPEVRRRMSDVVRQQATRHGWKMSYDLEVLNPRFRSHFAAPLLDSSEVSIVPGYFASPPSVQDEFGNGRLNLLIRQKFLNGNSYEQLGISAPERHHSICTRLFQSLGLERKFYAANDPIWESQVTVSADLRPWCTNYYPAHRVVHLFVYPSLIQREHRNQMRTLGSDGKTVVAFVNMRDPECASFCEQLEELDFHFSGIMVWLHERENIIYTRSSEFIPDYGDLPSEKAKALAHYIEKNDWNTTAPLFEATILDKQSQRHLLDS